jgi:hypothetical protein
MIQCPTCSFDNSDDSNFCRRCGTRLVGEELSDSTVTYAAVDGEQALEREPLLQMPPGPALEIRGGGGREGELVTLEADVITIGRSPDNDLFLDDVTVSRRHARIVRDGRGFLVEDLRSLNGTYVNRRRIERHRLRGGDELQIGKYKLVFIESPNPDLVGE